MDLFSQSNVTGALNYTINIGFYDALSKMQIKRNTDIATIAKRDWVTLNFNLADKDSKGVWNLIDGYSDYTKNG